MLRRLPVRANRQAIPRGKHAVKIRGQRLLRNRVVCTLAVPVYLGAFQMWKVYVNTM